MKAEKDGKSYNVMKNVSTHSMINANDGELDLRLELEDIGSDNRGREISFGARSDQLKINHPTFSF